VASLSPGRPGTRLCAIIPRVWSNDLLISSPYVKSLPGAPAASQGRRR
jgi:hypothetical protein